MRKILVFDTEGKFVVEIPDDAKITFGPAIPYTARNPLLPPGERAYSLRVYKGNKENLLAVFDKVVSFRDMDLLKVDIWEDDTDLPRGASGVVGPTRPAGTVVAGTSEAMVEAAARAVPAEPQRRPRGRPRGSRNRNRRNGAEDEAGTRLIVDEALREHVELLRRERDTQLTEQEAPDLRLRPIFTGGVSGPSYTPTSTTGWTQDIISAGGSSQPERAPE